MKPLFGPDERIHFEASQTSSQPTKVEIDIDRLTSENTDTLPHKERTMDYYYSYCHIVLMVCQQHSP